MTSSLRDQFEKIISKPEITYNYTEDGSNARLDLYNFSKLLYDIKIMLNYIDEQHDTGVAGATTNIILQQNYEKIKSQKKQLRKDFNSIIDNLNSNLSALNENITNKDAQISNLKTTIDTLQIENQSETDVKQEQIINKQKEIEIIKKDYDKYKKEQETIISKCNNDLYKLKTDNQFLLENIQKNSEKFDETIKNINNTSNSKILELEKNVINLTVKNSDLETKLVNTTKKMEEILNEKQGLILKNDNLIIKCKTDYDQLSLQYEQYKKQQEYAQNIILAELQEIKGDRDKISNEKNNIIDKQKTNILNLTKSNEEKDQKIMELERKYEEKRTEVEQITSQMKELKNKLDRATTSATEASEAESRRSTAYNENLITSQQTFYEELRKLTNQLSDISNENRTLNKTIETITKENEAIIKKNNDTQNVLNEQINEKETLNKKILSGTEEDNKKIANLTQQIGSLQEKEQDHQADHQQIEELQRELQQQKEQLKQTKYQNENLQKIINQLQQESTYIQQGKEITSIAGLDFSSIIFPNSHHLLDSVKGITPILNEGDLNLILKKIRNYPTMRSIAGSYNLIFDQNEIYQIILKYQKINEDSTLITQSQKEQLSSEKSGLIKNIVNPIYSFKLFLKLILISLLFSKLRFEGILYSFDNISKYSFDINRIKKINISTAFYIPQTLCFQFIYLSFDLGFSTPITTPTTTPTTITTTTTTTITTTATTTATTTTTSNKSPSNYKYINISDTDSFYNSNGKINLFKKHSNSKTLFGCLIQLLHAIEIAEVQFNYNVKSSYGFNIIFQSTKENIQNFNLYFLRPNNQIEFILENNTFNNKPDEGAIIPKICFLKNDGINILDIDFKFPNVTFEQLNASIRNNVDLLDYNDLPFIEEEKKEKVSITPKIPVFFNTLSLFEYSTRIKDDINDFLIILLINNVQNISKTSFLNDAIKNFGLSVLYFDINNNKITKDTNTINTMKINRYPGNTNTFDFSLLIRNPKDQFFINIQHYISQISGMLPGDIYKFTTFLYLLMDSGIRFDFLEKMIDKPILEKIKHGVYLDGPDTAEIIKFREVVSSEKYLSTMNSLNKNNCFYKIILEIPRESYGKDLIKKILVFRELNQRKYIYYRLTDNLYFFKNILANQTQFKYYYEILFSNINNKIYDDYNKKIFILNDLWNNQKPDTSLIDIIPEKSRMIRDMLSIISKSTNLIPCFNAGRKDYESLYTVFLSLLGSFFMDIDGQILGSVNFEKELIGHLFIPTFAIQLFFQDIVPDDGKSLEVYYHILFATKTLIEMSGILTLYTLMIHNPFEINNYITKNMLSGEENIEDNYSENVTNIDEKKPVFSLADIGIKRNVIEKRLFKVYKLFVKLYYINIIAKKIIEFNDKYKNQNNLFNELVGRTNEELTRDVEDLKFVNYIYFSILFWEKYDEDQIIEKQIKEEYSLPFIKKIPELCKSIYNDKNNIKLNDDVISKSYDQYNNTGQLLTNMAILLPKLETIRSNEKYLFIGRRNSYDFMKQELEKGKEEVPLYRFTDETDAERVELTKNRFGDNL
jgi:hypothetical protein